MSKVSFSVPFNGHFMHSFVFLPKQGLDTASLISIYVERRVLNIYFDKKIESY